MARWPLVSPELAPQTILPGRGGAPLCLSIERIDVAPDGIPLRCMQLVFEAWSPN